MFFYRRLAWVLLLAAGLLSPAWHAHAQQIDIPNRRPNFTPGELALLPPYCKDIQGMPGYRGAAGDRWRGAFGNMFQHMHHYCRGLRDVMFATMAAASPAQRKFLWERSINEYDYMIRNAGSNMALLPEIHFRRGESLVRLARLPEAEQEYERAWTLKPDYWPAYSAWAQQLIGLKLYARARSVLEAGLQHSPGEPTLTKLMAQVPGGTVPAARQAGEGGRGAVEAPAAPASAASAVQAADPDPSNDDGKPVAR